jgi:hypothetical protein
MPPTLETHSIVMCLDCVMYVSNGDLPEPTNDWHWSDGISEATFPDGWHPDNIDARWPPDEHWGLDVDGDDRDEHSNDTCDVCGCRVPGERHAGTATQYDK